MHKSKQIQKTQSRLFFKKQLKFYLYKPIQMKSEQQSLTQSLITETSSQQQTNNAQLAKYTQNIPTMNGVNFLQTLLFTWLYPFLSFGAKKTIKVETMPKLPHQMLTSTQYAKIWDKFQNIVRSKREGFTLLKIIAKTYYKPFFTILAFLLVYVFMQAVSPYLTAMMMKYIANKQDYQSSYGVILFVLIILLQVIKSISETHMGYRFTMLGLNVTNNLTLLIYTKSLRFASIAQKDFSESEIINYSQVDAQRFSSGGYEFAAILIAPLHIVVGIWLMYHFIGISFLAGIIVLILVLGITYFLTKRTFQYNKQLLQEKDARMKVTQEILDIIRYIKINAIEKFFYNKVDEKRASEISFYKKKGFMDVLSIFTYWLSCPLIISATFYTYILLGNQMDSEVAFTTIMIFTTLQYPIRLVPTSISSLIQIFTSLKRIQKFLLAQQINSNNVVQVMDNDSDYAIKIQRGNFYFGVEKEKQTDKEKNGKQDKKDKNNKSKQTQKPDQSGSKVKIDDLSEKDQASQSQSEDMNGLKDSLIKSQAEKTNKPNYVRVLKDINTTIRKQNFTIVIGDIGSGKSSLLLSILNEMIAYHDAKIQINGSIAYAAQKPWIISASVKSNILFESQYNEAKLKRVIHYACLEQDLKILPQGLETQIGEKGINISGGQKARIGLARALYSDKDIYLLDDILSAVDVHVGEFLMKQTLLGYLKGKTILMPTHAVKFAQMVDQVIVMKKGRVVRKGHFRDLVNTPQFQQIFKKQKMKQEKKQLVQTKDQKFQEGLKAEKKQILKKKQAVTATDKIVTSLMLPEDQEVGQVNYKIFKQYIRLNGGYFNFAFLVCFAMFMWICFTTSSSIIMQKWCEDPIGSNYDLYIYIGLSLGANIFIFFRVYKLILSSCRQGEKVHRQMMKSLLYASLGNFFNRIPIGRIINRLTKDLRQLDEEIAFKIGNVLVNIFLLLGDVVICIYGSTPFVIIPIVLVGYLSNRVRIFFMKSQIEVARYQKSTNSPIVSGFVSVISGLSTIRAYRMGQEFTNRQMVAFDINKRVRLTKAGMGSWFSINLTYLSFFVNLIAIGYCLLSDNSNASLGGLLMNYAINLSSDIIYTTNSVPIFESKLISLQRIYSFMKIEPQAAYLQYTKNWNSVQEGCKQVITRGDIQFRDLFARYRSDLPDALKGVTCQIKAGEKVGIVGRTGAGKTTIINTLLRITQISDGQLLIDGEKIDSFFIKQLRNSITMIDQEPTLLNSTFKENLDITGKHSEDEIYQILKQCNLYQTVVEKGGLNALVSNDSLSAGQKQLLCICRAFLKHSKIVLVDQATANIDVKNDRIIQRVISEKFKNCTVLTIAHRLSTLVNSDKIIVMENGTMVQFGSPAELQNKENGFYKQMVLKNAKEFLT